MDEEKHKKKYPNQGNRGGDLFSFLTIRVRADTYKAINALAEKDGRSTGGYIRRVIEKHVDRARELGI